MSDFFTALKSNVLVFDGPMGTELYRHHIFTNRCFEELNLSDSKLIARILDDYIEAGADVLTTNTFAANRPSLEKYGLADQLFAINRAGAEIAKELANSSERTVYVAGSIGPIQGAAYTEEQTIEAILEQVDPLTVGGADFIIFETQSSRESIELCAKAMKRRAEVPFVLSCAVIEGKESFSGESISRMLAPLPEECAEPIAWGLNCGSGPDGLLEPIEEALAIIKQPLIVQPNAGVPKEFEGRRLYYCSPEYVATYAMRYVNLGVAAIGGCCGMTPEHISEIAKMVKPLSKGHASRLILQSVRPEVLEQPEMPLDERSRFAWKLAHKKWVTTVEMVPPRGYDLEPLMEKCRALNRFGIDAINLPDGPRASSRIASLTVAQKMIREACIEPILHFCCRDRNLIGMQADLLACAASGVRNILFITGDPPKLGNYPNATGVFDTDSIGMCSVQKRLNKGIDLGGQGIDPPTRAVIGVGLDPTAIDRKREIDRFRKKIESGAEFAITQPVFDPNALLEMLDEIGDCPIPILAGVWPLASYRNALFMQNEVPGVVIPDEMMKRMEESSKGSKEDQMNTGIEIARESIQAVRDRVSGVQASAPFGRIDIVMRLLENM